MAKRILVVGGGTLVGDNIAAALLSEGADVTLLVRPGAEDRLGPLAKRTRWYTADVWDTASLRGRARGAAVVINTIGSLLADPKQGLTHHRLNFVSARHIAAMCVSDGVPEMILLSAAYAPWLSRSYIQSKREAERYLVRVGITGTIIRAPLVYIRGQKRTPFFELISLIGNRIPFRWTPLGQVAPIPVDVLARGVARIALSDERKTIYRASDLRRLNRKDELLLDWQAHLQDGQTERPADWLPEDAPFGWFPPEY